MLTKFLNKLFKRFNLPEIPNKQTIKNRYLETKKKIKKWWRRLVFLWTVGKWVYVYWIFKYHDVIGDFLFLLFRGFSFKFKTYYETMVMVEIYMVGVAIFFIQYFLWKHLIYRFLGIRFSTPFYFVYIFFFLWGSIFYLLIEYLNHICLQTLTV